MTNPLDLLRQGLKTGDWAKVSQGFKALTGETIEAPQGSSDNQGLLVAIYNLVAPVVASTPQPVATVASDPTNGFVPDPTEFAEETKIRPVKLTPRTRSEANTDKVKITCQTCNQTFELERDFLPKKTAHDDDPPPYICDRCIGRRVKK